MSEARRLKSRAGCSQCKRRRVKCDESLPTCHQCSRQNLQCPGYQKPLKWIDSQEKAMSQDLLPNHARKSIASKSNRRSSLYCPKATRLFIQGHKLPRSLDDEPTMLIDHYFTKVCKIVGCFDSDLNPFQFIPASMMAYSKPVYLILQASSAAQLSNQYPTMLPQALSLQSAAFSAIRDEIAKLQISEEKIVSDELMLSIILAGMTSTWYNVNDTGQSHVIGGKVLFNIWLQQKSPRLQFQQTFILGVFLYWNMTSSFVSYAPDENFDYQAALQLTVRHIEMSHKLVDNENVPQNLRKVIAHPLAGFSTDLVILVGMVASLCRMRQSGIIQGLFGKARAVESELLDLVLPQESSYTDLQDPQRRFNNILQIGEGYRCAGLLQLYTTFPELLQLQAGRQRSSAMDRSGSGPPLETDILRLPSVGQYTPLQFNWLRALALHILELLAEIPVISGTGIHQRELILIAATWVVDPIDTYSSYPEEGAIQTTFKHSRLFFKPSVHSKEHWRDIIRSGVHLGEKYIGLEEVPWTLDLLEEIWRSDDSGGRKAHWMEFIASRRLRAKCR